MKSKSIKKNRKKTKRKLGGMNLTTYGHLITLDLTSINLSENLYGLPESRKKLPTKDRECRFFTS